MLSGDSLMAQEVKSPPAMQEMRFLSLVWEDTLEEEMATHSSILAWEIPWTEEPGGLQSRGSQKIRQDWVHSHAHIQVSWKGFPDLSGWGISATYRSPPYWVSFFLVPDTMAGVHVFMQLFNTSLDSLEAPQRQAWEWPPLTTVSLVSASRMGTWRAQKRLQGLPCFSSVQLLSCVQLFAIPWTAACQASLSITNSWSLLKLMPIESVMPSNHLILCRPLLLLPSVFPSIRIFSSESVLCFSWPKYWSFSFNISFPGSPVVNTPHFHCRGHGFDPWLGS